MGLADRAFYADSPLSSEAAVQPGLIEPNRQAAIGQNQPLAGNSLRVCSRPEGAINNAAGFAIMSLSELIRESNGFEWSPIYRKREDVGS